MQTNVVISNRATRLVQLSVNYDANYEPLEQPTRVDWGDGSSTTIPSDPDGGVSVTHTYAAEGVYKVVCQSNAVRTEQVVVLADPPAARDTHESELAIERDVKQLSVTGRLG